MGDERGDDERAAALWNRIGLAFAKYPRAMDEEERAARAAFMAFCDEQQAEIARLRRALARYADRDNWDYDTVRDRRERCWMGNDGPAVARDALAAPTARAGGGG